MWGWFGGAAAQKRKDAPKSAILDLRSQLDMLTKREKHLMTQIEEQEALARKNVTTNKTGKLDVAVTPGIGVRGRQRTDLYTFNSGQGSPEAEEEPRVVPRADDFADRNAGAADQLDRIGKHQ